MTTPNRSVEEIVEEFRKLLIVDQTNMQVVELLDKPNVEIRIPFAEDWLTQTLTAERQKREEERERAVRLYDLLDDIDSTPDVLHPNTPEGHELCWRDMVKTAHKRHEVFITDGFTLTPKYQSELDQPNNTNTNSVDISNSNDN